MICSSEFNFAAKLLQKYHLNIHLYKFPLTEDVIPDLGLRQMINPDIDYKDILSSFPEHFRPNTLYKTQDLFFCHYLFFLMPDTEEKTFAAIGPYYLTEVTSDIIFSISQKLSLSPEKTSQLEKFYQNIPFIPDEQKILNIIFTLCEYLWGDMDNFSVHDGNDYLDGDLEYLTTPRHTEDEQEALLSMKFLEERYSIESQLMQAVSQGQTHKAEMYLANFETMQMESRASDPLQSLRYYCIVLNTLLRKAAEYGAVHPIHIDSLSSRFARKIEAAVSQKALMKLQTEMVHKYCLLVKNHSLKGYSLLVRKVLTRIDSDLTADLSLHTQAELLNVNSSYLSTLFRKETGVTLTDYVNKKRMEHAILLLNSTTIQIQTIAQHCGIPDVNYFTKTFKKYIGRTPKEYRDIITSYKNQI